MMDEVKYNTNAGGYYFVTLRIETGDLCWGFEEYNHYAGSVYYPEYYNNKLEYHKALAEQLKKFKYTVPNFYKLICDMLKRNNRKIEDYENDDT